MSDSTMNMQVHHAEQIQIRLATLAYPACITQCNNPTVSFSTILRQQLTLPTLHASLHTFFIHKEYLFCAFNLFCVLPQPKRNPCNNFSVFLWCSFSVQYWRALYLQQCHCLQRSIAHPTTHNILPDKGPSFCFRFCMSKRAQIFKSDKKGRVGIGIGSNLPE